ncbi:MAG: hypothetical protein HZC06_02790 [Methylocystis sp.]|nr:hypothetical protein [Methylocystis sp.]
MPSAESISTAIPYLAMALGLLCATGGGELFVRGTVGIASAARVAPSIIAATVAAFATSSPELTVAIQSGLAGEPEISLGDALGSNVANLALIFGVALLFGPLAIIRAQVTRNFAVAVAAPVALSVMLIDGSLSRLEARDPLERLRAMVRENHAGGARAAALGAGPAGDVFRLHARSCRDLDRTRTTDCRRKSHCLWRK